MTDLELANRVRECADGLTLAISLASHKGMLVRVDVRETRSIGAPGPIPAVDVLVLKSV